MAIGRAAMFNNTTGLYNTAIGRGALNGDKTSSQSTACGYKSLNVSTGASNSALGYQTMLATTTGTSNTASGWQALVANTTGSVNTAIGASALGNNTTGINNIAVGFTAGSNLTTGNTNIDIGAPGVSGESSTIRIGTSSHTNTYIAGISGVTVAGGIGVIVDSNGHLGTMTSSARYKENIRPMDKASEAILSLKPVTFRYKKKFDPKATPEFGVVAEQVEKVDPELVVRDDQGKPYSVRYEAVNAMLLNEFLKEHGKVEELEATVAKLQSTIEKVSARLETRDTKERLVDSH